MVQNHLDLFIKYWLVLIVKSKKFENPVAKPILAILYVVVIYMYIPSSHWVYPECCCMIIRN